MPIEVEILSLGQSIVSYLVRMSSIIWELRGLDNSAELHSWE